MPGKVSSNTKKGVKEAITFLFVFFGISINN